MNNHDKLEADIAAAIEDNMNIKKWPLTATGKPADAIPGSGATKEGRQPRRTADQLSLCVAGLLKIEEEFARIADELVGPMPEPADAVVDPGQRPSAIFDRLRNDTRILADLAIRLDRRLRHMREHL